MTTATEQQAPPTAAEQTVLTADAAKAPWRMVQRIDDTDIARAVAQAETDLAAGATGFAIVFEGAPNAFGYGLPGDPAALEAVLDVLPLKTSHLRIDVHPASRMSLDWMVECLTRMRANPAHLSLSFGIDPAAVFAGTGRLRMSIEALKASMPQSLAHFFAMQVPGVLLEADGRVYHNGGATHAQELGAMIASAVSHLRMFEAARQPLVYAAPHIGFSLSVDDDAALGAAKIGALRMLWGRALNMFGIEAPACSVHAETSFRMLTGDIALNAARAAIACHGAVAGGANTISVLPPTMALGLPDSVSRRLALDTQLILAESAAKDGAVHGSGAMDAEAVSTLAEQGWAEFETIESEGGILDSLLSGKLQARVAEARDSRARSETPGGVPGIYLAEKRPLPTDGLLHCEMIPPFAAV